jgi:hypothetical protein
MTQITFNAYSLKAETANRSELEVTVEADLRDILNSVSMSEIVGALDLRKLLDEIGEEAAREHFGIEGDE